MTYYAGWDEFYQQNKKEYCWGGKGRKHEFERIEGQGSSYERCKLCGYKLK